MPNRNIITTTVVLTLILAALAFAGVPQTINYQGYLKDTAGAPVSTATSMTFSLYSTASGAGAVWIGSKSVTPVNGIYSVELGATPQPALPAFDRKYWLGVKAGADSEMRPLQPLSSAPYALRAAVADNVNISPGQYKYTVSGDATISYNGALLCACDVNLDIKDCPTTHYSSVDIGPVCYDVFISGGYNDPPNGWVDEYSGVPYARGSYTPLLATGTYGNIGINTGTPMYDLDVNGTVRATNFIGSASGSDLTGIVATTHGGTGIATAPTSAGQYLRSTGAGTWGINTIPASDLPDLSARFAPAVPPVQNPRINTITTVDSNGFVGLRTSVTIGTDGLPIISYFDNTNKDLKVAKCTNTACTGIASISTVDSTGSVGDYNSITIGTDGLPIISYNDSTNFDLKVAKCGNTACSSGNTITTVDSTGNMGAHTSITIGTDSRPVISYTDLTNNRLKLARCANAACSGTATFTIIDDSGNVGRYTSIAISTDGMPVISYSDSNNSSLKVAKCLIADCSFLTSTATVDSTGNVGQYTSITIGTDGLPVISYYDNANGDLKVAKCANAACSGTATITTVDTGGAAVVGEYSSITIGTDGLPVISYYDNSNGNLKVAKCPNAACGGAATISTVDSTGDVGQYTSITIGTDGLPVISYFDATNGDLKVAKCANQFCINNWSRR
jgi:predicted regulator of Ras-like GTPase activity (Roadblock/LC7/MglB family)